MATISPSTTSNLIRLGIDPHLRRFGLSVRPRVSKAEWPDLDTRQSRGARRRGRIGSVEARQAIVESEQVERVLARLGKRCVVLVGMMGAGKTSIGRRLANLLHLPFLDADSEIEKAANL